MKEFFRLVILLAEKDLRIELRSKETMYSIVLFVILTLFIFNFSFSLNPEVVNKVAPGIIWVVIAFSGLIAISHLAEREQDERAGEGVLLTGVTGTTLFFGKFVSALVVLTAIECLTVPLFMVFFNFQIGEWFVLFMSILALGTIGYAAVGTLFAGLLSHSRLKDLFLPVVFYPVIIPLFIFAVKATGTCLSGYTPTSELAAMLGFDIIFLTASALLFDFVVEDPS